MALAHFMHSPLFRRYAKLLAACLLVFCVFSVRQQIKQMDERFFQPSFEGAVGLEEKKWVGSLNWGEWRWW
ncbi:MAG: hypothetical protein ACREI9_13410 [Nitrospiraceae bacterium]